MRIHMYDLLLWLEIEVQRLLRCRGGVSRFSWSWVAYLEWDLSFIRQRWVMSFSMCNKKTWYPWNACAIKEWILKWIWKGVRAECIPHAIREYWLMHPGHKNIEMYTSALNHLVWVGEEAAGWKISGLFRGTLCEASLKALGNIIIKLQRISDYLTNFMS